MEWLVEEYEGVVVTKMSSNKLNLMNDAFFNDLNTAFDKIENEYPRKPVVLTSVGNVFSAGLDLDYCFPIFKDGNRDEIKRWFETFRDSLLRVFKFERPLLAAVNGHAIAGGLILALCCDIRIAISTSAKFGLNEVTVGFPLPGFAAELIKNSIGTSSAEELIYKGHLYDSQDMLKLGVFHDITDEQHLFNSVIAQGKQFLEASMPAYSYAKKILRKETIDRINSISAELDSDLLSELSSSDTINSIEKILMSLKKR